MSQATSETDRIQNDIDSARARMDDRLTQLEGKLSPGQLLDDVMRKFNGSDGGVFARDLMDSIRGAPIPATLTGIGLAWLMATKPKSQQTSVNSNSGNATSRWPNAEAFDRHLQELDNSLQRRDDEEASAFEGRRHEARAGSVGVARAPEDSHESFGERVQSAVAATRDLLTRTAHDAADGVSTVASKMSEAARGTTDQVSDTVQALPQMAKDVFASVSANPVVLGALGLAVGALLGAVVPQTSVEESALQGAATKLREGVSDVVQKTVDKGSELGKAALKAAGETAQETGLSTDKTLGDLAADVSSGDLVQGAKKVATDVIKSVHNGLAEQTGNQR